MLFNTFVFLKKTASTISQSGMATRAKEKKNAKKKNRMHSIPLKLLHLEEK